MKPFLSVALMCLLASAPALRADTLAPEDQYFNIYSLILKADRLTEKGKEAAARTNYVQAEIQLKKFQEDFPLWNPKVVKYRINYLDTKLAPPEAIPGGMARPQSHSSSSTGAPGMTANLKDSGAPVEMKLKWQTGKRYGERLEATITSDANLPGQSQPMKSELELGQDFALSAIKELDNGGRELELELSGTTIDVKSGGVTAMSFDSKQPPADAAGNPAVPYLKRIAGAKLRFLTGANGNIESVEGLDDFIKTIMGPDSPEAAAAIQSLSGMGDKWKDMMANSSGLPDKPVKVGDTWSRNTDINAGTTSASQAMDYTFTGWETHDGYKCAVIQYTGDVTPKGADSDPTSVQVHMSGTMWFDPELGTTIDNKTKLGINVKVNMGNQAMNTAVNGDVSVKLASLTDIPQ